MSMTRIVLAYSGSARSSIALRWMIEAWQAEVVTLTLDLGQRDELDAVRERALACGATRAHVLDERESFARDYLLPALRAGAACEDGWPLGRLLTRPLIARQVAEVARMEGAGTIAHAAWRDHDDRVRLERAMRDAGPDLTVRAPLVDANLGDGDMLAFAKAHALPIPRLDTPVDANLWERCTREPLAGAEAPVVDRTPDSSAIVVLELLRGTPVGLNGVTMPLLEIISSLETIASAHGLGRMQQLTRPLAGSQTPMICQRCDAPAATLLDAALRQAQRLVLAADAARDVTQVSALYRDIIARGAWSAVSRQGCDAFVDTVQARMTGAVRLRLFKGSVSVLDCAFADERVDVAHA
jgi:argininosuccinate synthase